MRTKTFTTWGRKLSSVHPSYDYTPRSHTDTDSLDYVKRRNQRHKTETTTTKKSQACSHRGELLNGLWYWSLVVVEGAGLCVCVWGGGLTLAVKPEVDISLSKILWRGTKAWACRGDYPVKAWPGLAHPGRPRTPSSELSCRSRLVPSVRPSVLPSVCLSVCGWGDSGNVHIKGIRTAKLVSKIIHVVVNGVTRAEVNSQGETTTERQRWRERL